MTLRFAFVTTVFAPLVLAALPGSARGQSLDLESGDTLTVSGLGTAGNIGTTVYTPPNAMTTISATNGYYALETDGTSTFTLEAGGAVTGGSNAYGLFADGTGTDTISGGTLSGFFGVSDGGGGTVVITGGTITGGSFGILSQNSSVVDVAGGAISGGAMLNGSATIGAEFGGVIDFFGTGFSYTVNNVTTPITSGDLPTDTSQGVTGTVQGTLLDGEALDASFKNYAVIEVNVGTPPSVPEPSQLVALALSALGLVGRRCRRSPASPSK